MSNKHLLSSLHQREVNKINLCKLQIGNCPICGALGTVKFEDDFYECYQCHHLFISDYSPKNTNCNKYKGNLIRYKDGEYKYV